MGQQLIKSIYIEGLFGLYTYNLGDVEKFDNAAILYGDNGVGKSTILRLAFHLMSAGYNRGHRTALYKANFKKMEITLASGITLCAVFEIKKDRRWLNLIIRKNDVDIAVWEYIPGKSGLRKVTTDDGVLYIHDDDEYEIEYITKEKSNIDISLAFNSKKKIRGEKHYLEILNEVTPNMFILNADRRLDSDSVTDPNDEVELRQTIRSGAPKRINDLVVRSREIALSQALNVANKWIARKAVLGTNKGSDNVHSVYIKILSHLVSVPDKKSRDLYNDEVNSLILKLKEISEETKQLAKYEFATALDMSEFESALRTQYDRQNSLPVDLLNPYIESLDGRLQAVRSIYKIVDKFISIVNDLLSDKKIGFHLSQGFFIKNTFGESLEPSQLSSGEQQLLLLFCYVLVARDVSSIFIIDEPEISLNIKWQRKLVQALLDITEDADIQFIFASHSLEIISQHRSKVIKLVNENAYTS